MKARRVGFALAMLATLAISAGSAIARVRAEPKPARPPTAYEKLVRQMGRQLCSDVFMKRELDARDVERLLAFAKRDGIAGSEALHELITLRFTSYHDEVLRIAFRKATREEASAAFTAIGLMESWKEPRWRALAEAHTSEPGEWGDAFRQMIEWADESPPIVRRGSTRSVRNVESPHQP